MQEIVNGVQTYTVWGPPKYRKHTELRSAIQTKPAFENLQRLQTITQSQQSRQKLIIQQDISLQGQTVIVTKERVLNQHSRYIRL